MTVIDRNASLLSALVPPELSSRLTHRLMNNGVRLLFQTEITTVARHHGLMVASFSDGQQRSFDAIVCAIGLRANTSLAKHAGILVRRGIVVDDTLATDTQDVYALGDCAEIQGRVMPYLQPAALAAMTLGKILSGQNAKLTLPKMLINVKTPDMPLQLAGDPTNPAYTWTLKMSPTGIIAKGYDENSVLRAFVVSEDNLKLASSMLKDLKLPGTA